MLVKIREQLWIDLDKVTFASFVSTIFTVKLENDSSDYEFPEHADVCLIERALNKHFGHPQSPCEEFIEPKSPNPPDVDFDGVI